MTTAYLDASHELLQDLDAIYPGYIKIEEVVEANLFRSLVRFSCKDLPDSLDGKLVSFRMRRNDTTLFYEQDS